MGHKGPIGEAPSLLGRPNWTKGGLLLLPRVGARKEESSPLCGTPSPLSNLYIYYRVLTLLNTRILKPPLVLGDPVILIIRISIWF